MSSKQPQLTEKPAALSSSEEEEVSDEESESSEDSKSGTAVENQSTPTVAPILEKKPVADPETESESESETGSDSDSDSESESPPVATNTVPVKSSTVTVLPETTTVKHTLAGVGSEEPEKEKTEATNTVPVKSSTVTVLPETTTVKRTLAGVGSEEPEKEKTEAKTEPAKSSTVTVLPETMKLKRTLAGVSSEEPDKKKAKAKTSSTPTEVVPNEEVKKLLFQRLFSKEDELALLQGMIAFTGTKGVDPLEDSDAFCEFVKKLIKFDANRAQIVNKVRRLKKKYENCVKNSLKKGKTEDDITFSKQNDQNAFELSRKIWGNEGLVCTHTSKKKAETKIKTSVFKSQVAGEDMACFIKKEFSGCVGLSVADLITAWDLMVDESTKLEIEEKMKRLKTMEVKLLLDRIQFFADSAKMIVSAFASSSGN